MCRWNRSGFSVARVLRCLPAFVNMERASKPMNLKKQRFVQFAALTQSWYALVLLTALVGLLLVQHWEAVQTGKSRHIELAVVGERLRSFELETLEGKPAIIDWNSDSRSTVLYALSPLCPFCEENLAAIQTLAEGTASRYRFIGVSLASGGLREYLARAHYNFPIYVLRKKSQDLKLPIAPDTIVVSPKGVVTQVWHGVYTARESMSLQRTFGVVLDLQPEFRN